jgi:hypothetical protein
VQKLTWLGASAPVFLLAGGAWLYILPGTPTVKKEDWTSAFIVGRVHFTGFRPVRPPPVRIGDLEPPAIQSEAREECESDFLPQDQSVILNDDCALKNVFIHLSGGLPDDCFPSAPLDGRLVPRHGPPLVLGDRQPW